MKLTATLLDRLNRVFDKDPHSALAMRLSYDGSMTWTIVDGVLSTTVSGGSGTGLQVDLSTLTIGQLATFFQGATGYSVPYLDADSAGLGAIALLHGTGDIASSNGDHLYRYTTLLWAILEAFSRALVAARAVVAAAPGQLQIGSASDMWLDEIGGYYGVVRMGGELDASFGPRIVAQVLLPRANNTAMEKAIETFTGWRADVVDGLVSGPAFPAHDGLIKHDGTYQHNASPAQYPGVFDITVHVPNLAAFGDTTAIQAQIRALVETLRASGTFLRNLSLSAS